jgi:hypothetical protein
VTQDTGTQLAITSPTPAFKISRDARTLAPLNVSRFVRMESLDFLSFSAIGFQLYWLDASSGNRAATLVQCGRDSLFSSVVVNPTQSAQLILTAPREGSIDEPLFQTLAGCGVPATVTDMFVFPVPLNAVFSLEGSYRVRMQMLCDNADVNCVAADF